MIKKLRNQPYAPKCEGRGGNNNLVANAVSMGD
jgi:hypothetical protein